MQFFTTSFALLFTILSTAVQCAPLAPSSLTRRFTAPDGQYLQTLRVHYLSSWGVLQGTDYSVLWPYDQEDINPPRDFFSQLGGVCDINKGFGGNVVLLEPVWTSDVGQAITYIKSYHSKIRAPGSDDLARGSGGDYRYLEMGRIIDQKPLRSVSLYRSKSRLPGVPTNYGYKWATADINEGRGGDYLHILYGN